MMLRLCSLGMALAISTSTAALADPPAPPIAIVHGRLLTVSHGTVEDGVLVMREGRIVAVGPAGTPIPADARRVDARGKTVYPGLIDVEDALGLVETNDVAIARASLDPAGTPIPAAMIADVVHPTGWIDVERLNGITGAVVSAGAEGPLPGHSAAIRLVDTKSEMIVRRDVGLVINFEGRRADAYPTTVFGIVGYVRDLMTRAQQLLATGQAPGPDDATAAAFLPALKGEVPIIAHVTNDTEAGDALDLAEQFHLKLILVGLAGVDTEIDRIARAHVPVVVGMLLDDPAPGQRYDYIFRLPARLAAKGIAVSIATLGRMPGGVRNLPYEAGISAAFGFGPERALRAITLAPAEAFGLGAELGSLDPGKSADVVIADGDPLDVLTNVEQVFIQGRPLPMTSRQTRLRDQYTGKAHSPPPAAAPH